MFKNLFPPNIDNYLKSKNVTALIECLGYKNSDAEKQKKVQIDAVKALGKIGDKTSTQALINNLSHIDKEVVEATITTLSEIGAPESIIEIVKLVKNSTKNFYHEGIVAIGKIGGDVGIEALIELLINVEEKKGYVISEAFHQIGESSVDPLISLLGNNNEINTQVYGIIALGKIGNNKAINFLVKMMRNQNHRIRMAATEGLENQKWLPTNDEDLAWFLVNNQKINEVLTLGAVAVPAIMENLNYYIERDLTKEAVNHLVGNLWYIDGADVPLIEFINKVQDKRTPYAIQALGEIHSPLACNALINMLKKESFNFSAIRAVGNAGDKRAIPYLLNCFIDHQDHFFHNAIARALDQLDWKPERNLESIYYWIAKGDEQKCLELSDISIDPFVAMLNEEDYNTRVYFCENVLIKIGKKSIDSIKRWMVGKEEKDLLRANSVLLQIEKLNN